MEATELRIGNLLDFQGRYCKILEIDNQGVVVEFINDGETIWIDLFQFSKIPLTEELLLKLGFKKYTGWDDMFYWCLPDEHEDSNRFEVFENQTGFELPSGAICESVHLLQNAYFFHYLNGKELTIITDAKS